MGLNFKKTHAAVLSGAAIFVSICVLCVFFAACGDGGEAKNSSGAADPGVPESTKNAESGEKTTESRLFPDLPAQDFGGYEFVFLTRTLPYADWAEWDHRDIAAEEINGDVMNDAVYARNSKIEEKYNIRIIDIKDDDVPGKTSKAVKSGEDLYDIVCPHIVEFTPMAQSGLFTDIFAMPCLDLEKPWWDRGTIDDLSIMHRLFLLQGDLLIMNNDAMEAMVFNKSIVRDHGLESPYAIVKRGEWTIGKLTEMSRGIAQDLNGDGEMYIKDDLFGCILQADSDISFLVASGEKICSKDSDDYPIITFGSERCYTLLDAVSALMLDEQNVVHLHRYEGKFPIYDEQVKMMEENRALFSWIKMRIVERLRGMENDFGILPLPKLDKTQAQYITHNNPHSGVGICMPVSATDFERTGTILEDLCAESRYTLQPAYYEINLCGKYARDDESQEMLDIIFANIRHDIGYVYNFGNFAMTTLLRNGQNKKSDYASPFEKARDKMQADIDKTVEKFDNVNG